MSLILENIDHMVNGATHIEGVNLELAPGSFNVLLGRTLAGKTTLMRIMAGLETPTRGRVLMHGEDVTRKSVRKRNVSMVYQQFINYPSLTVFDNIASPLKLARVPRDEIRERVHDTARMLHIEHLLGRYPSELSGGQQQRTAMGRALVKDADLILFDEPLVNLDYKLREEFRESCASCSRRATASPCMPPPSPTRRWRWAAIPRYCTRGACCNMAPPRMSITARAMC